METIRKAAEAIASVCSPVRIILFGSRARDEQREDSDLDFCLIFRDEDPRNPDELYEMAYEAAAPYTRRAMDFLITTCSRFIERASSLTIESVIDREGIVLYDDL